jgi:uncharacterized protein
MVIETTLILCAFSFSAGLIDAVAGGGGLILIPALLIFRPDLAPAAVLATNKLAACFGTATATAQYAQGVRIPWRVMLPAAAVAFAASWLGARTVASLPPANLRPVIVGLLFVVAGYTVWKKDLGRVHEPRGGLAAQRRIGVLAGLIIGFYDGFFGPGTGSFLIFVLVRAIGFDFLHASASAKVVNLSTNLAALAFFVPAGLVRWELAIPLAACNVAGGLVGSRLAMRRGSAFIRAAFLVVLAALLLKLGADLFRR